MSFVWSLCFVGDQDVPCTVQWVYEHSAASGADPLQPAAVGGARQPAEPPQGHQGSGGHVLGAGGGLWEHAGRQGARLLDVQVLPLTQTAGRLRVRFPAKVSRFGEAKTIL